MDRIQSALRGLTMPPPHHVTPPSARVPTALASAEYVFVREDASILPLSQLYHGLYEVLSHQDKFFSLEIGSKQDTVSIDRLKPVLGPVLCPQQPPWRGRPPASTSVPLPMVRDPGLNPFKDILPRSTPKLQRGSRPPRGRPQFQPPDLGLLPAPAPLLEVASAPVRRNPPRLVRRILPAPSSTPSPPRRPWR